MPILNMTRTCLGGKIVLLPCDDPEWSNFTRYFAAKFDELGLKKLISTSYAPDAKKMKLLAEPSLFEKEAPQFDPQKAQTKGKIFVLEKVMVILKVKKSLNFEMKLI